MSERMPLNETPEAAPSDARSSIAGSLTVAGVSFVIVLGMIVGVWVMTSRRQVAAASAPRASSPAALADAEVVTLLDNNYFVTPLPPAGDRSVTYQYTIAVKVAKGRRGMLDQLVAPDGRNMICAVREQVRRIIAAEDYLKLRGEQLDDVKRRIRHTLNSLLSAEVVEDVIFDKWNVIS